MKSPKQFLASVTRTRISLVGSVLTTVSAILFLGVLGAELMGFEGGPYTGILSFLVVPLLFVAGLLLIPFGLWLDRRRRKKHGESAAPVIDLNSRTTNRTIRIFIVATIANLVILAVAAFKGVEVMESNAFCGQTCHKVMNPEFTTYQRSPHARVNCVSCHIGSGASWFVKSKLSGSWQLVSVALNLYPRPIEAPVHNLRPARDTCEQCHWPTKFTGDKLRVISHFKEDEANTETKTVLMVKVGGHVAGDSHGIHWHVDPRNMVRYRADAKRETMYEVERLEGGKLVQTWRGPEADKPEAQAATTWRTMDCIDCHNRPAHIYMPPEDEMDHALADGRLDKTVPFLRREGLKALRQEYTTQQAARAGIQQALTAFYGKSYPAVTPERVAAAGKVLGDIWATNVFPEMKITWGTYKNQLGHAIDTGCMRCHNGEHKSKDGKATIAGDCDTCHNILADSEENPEILKTLQP